jgi:hypothetical protein
MNIADWKRPAPEVKVAVRAFERQTPTPVFVIDPLSPPLTRDVLMVILAKLGVYTFFRSRRVCKRWNEWICTLMLNVPPWFAREIPRFLEQLGKHFLLHKAHTMLRFTDGVMGDLNGQSIHAIWSSRVAFTAPCDTICYCGKPLAHHVCEKCRRDDFCSCFHLDNAHHMNRRSPLPRCCSDPLCCLYAEFIRSYGVCACLELRFQKTCTGRHLSSYFPWEKRFDHRPGAVLVDARQMRIPEGAAPILWDDGIIDSDEEQMPFRAHHRDVFVVVRPPKTK